MSVLARFFTVVFVLGLSAFPLSSSAQASPSYDPPPSVSHTWRGTLSAKGVTVSIVLQASGEGSGTVQVRATGLNANGRYSFWTVGPGGATQGLGQPPFEARANGAGALVYAKPVQLGTSPAGLKVVVKYHPPKGSAVTLVSGVLHESDR